MILGGHINLNLATIYGILMGILGLVAAVLIALYKRFGLFPGLGIFGLSFVLTASGVLSLLGNSTVGVGILFILFPMLIEMAALYYLYIYLTREPEKTFFT